MTPDRPSPGSLAVGRPATGHLALGFVLFGLVLIGAAVFLVHPGPLGVDAVILRELIATRTPGLTTIVDGLSRLFSPVAMCGWTALIVVALVMRDRHLGRALPVLAAAAAAAAAGTVVKVAVSRPRPPEVLQVGTPEATYSFPSGHVGGTTALVVALLLVAGAGLPRLWHGLAALVAAAVIVVCAWTRLYLGVHWCSDVVGGALLGTSAALLIPPIATYLLNRIANRFPVKGLRP